MQKNMEHEMETREDTGVIMRMTWDSLPGWGLCQESVNVKVKRGLCSFPWLWGSRSGACKRMFKTPLHGSCL